MFPPHGHIRVGHEKRVKHDRVHEMTNGAFGIQGGMELK